MKTSQLAARAAAVMCLCALVPKASLAQGNSGNSLPLTDPLLPVGVMTAFPTMVQTGTKPTLTWNILHPSKVSDLAVINPPGTIIPNQTVYVTVQIIGTGVTTCQGSSTVVPPTDLRVSVNGGSYAQLFYGTQAAVNSSQKLWVKKVNAGQTIDLGGRYVIGSGWSPFFTTRSSNMQVISLINGNSLPTRSQFQGQATLASYLLPYLDASKKVRVGPLSILVLMELGQTNPNSPCFDYQDQVALVTLSRKHPNNGHGNNLDGVDSSNPGQGGGGPNGRVDPSGGIDDEIR